MQDEPPQWDIAPADEIEHHDSSEDGVTDVSQEGDAASDGAGLDGEESEQGEEEGNEDYEMRGADSDAGSDGEGEGDATELAPRASPSLNPSAQRATSLIQRRGSALSLEVALLKQNESVDQQSVSAANSAVHSPHENSAVHSPHESHGHAHHSGLHSSPHSFHRQRAQSAQSAHSTPKMQKVYDFTETGTPGPARRKSRKQRSFFGPKSSSRSSLSSLSDSSPGDGSGDLFSAPPFLFSTRVAVGLPLVIVDDFDSGSEAPTLLEHFSLAARAKLEEVTPLD
jgi:hypothetical protein